MSRLRLYWPDARGQIETATFATAESPAEAAVIPFARFRRKAGGHSPATDALQRAQAIHANSCCPVCRHPVVQPLELNDAAVGRGNLPIPGTATLVGFRCERCDAEWPA